MEMDSFIKNEYINEDNLEMSKKSIDDIFIKEEVIDDVLKMECENESLNTKQTEDEGLKDIVHVIVGDENGLKQEAMENFDDFKMDIDPFYDRKSTLINLDQGIKEEPSHPNIYEELPNNQDSDNENEEEIEENEIAQHKMLLRAKINVPELDVNVDDYNDITDPAYALPLIDHNSACPENSVYTVETSRGGVKLVDKMNYVYRIDKKRSEKTYWKCENKECKARVHTVLEFNNLSVCKTVSEHSHPSQPSKPKVYKSMAALKSSATNSQTSARALIADISSNLSIDALAMMPSSAHLSRNIRGWRQKESQAPSIPTGRSGYAIPDEYKFLQNGEQFLLYDSGEDDEERILVFGTQAGLDDLANNKNWACDGTFKCSPDIYYQLFTLHIVLKNISIPRLFILLPGKSEVTYSTLFSALKDMRPSLEPETLMVDFEKATINAFSSIFTTTTITGCLFHMAKNMYRKIVDIGLKVRYQTDSEFNTKIKCFTALAFLPVSDVIDGFVDVTDDDDLPQEFIAYFETHYIGGERGRGARRRRMEPTFPLDLWNVFARTHNNIPRTNNSVEGFHHAIQSSITNNSIWKVIDFLKKEESFAKKKICDADQGDAGEMKKKYSDINTRLQRQVNRYNPQQKVNYLRSIASNLDFFLNMLF